jgi:hypothetical protein
MEPAVVLLPEHHHDEKIILSLVNGTIKTGLSNNNDCTVNKNDNISQANCDDNNDGISPRMSLSRRISMVPENLHSMFVQRLEDIRRNHTYSTVAFCTCIFAHTYLSNSLFPYAGFMAIQLRDLSEEAAGIPGGFLCSVFLFARALSSYQ